MAPYVNCCVILLEVCGDGHQPLINLSFKSQKYRDATLAGSSSELQFGRGDKTQTRGLRAPISYTVETLLVSNIMNEEEKSEKPKDDDEGSASPPPPGVGAMASSSCTDLELPKKVCFFSGNSFVEITKGIIHLYKENERTHLDLGKENSNPGPSDMLLMLSVPCYLSCRDLLQFVAPFQKDLDHIQIIREATPNQYMALLKCNSEVSAAEVYKAMNGVPYNSLEEEVCRMAFVSRVESMKDDGGMIGLPLLGHTELPTCPVCLERMDESVDGILTILCNHTFHSGCLSKWSDSRCPVCRYVQTPEMVAKNVCFECGSCESLWICLICGHIGCGRYVQGHAYKHFCETSHCYAIQPDNNRVWDYAGDNFVHRLLQNKDGKLVEVGGVGNRGRASDNCEDSDEKVDNLQLEFTYLLTTQLEAQRHFFEERLEEQAKDFQKEVEKLQLKVVQTANQKQEVECRLVNTKKERAALEKKLVAVNSKLSKVSAELKEEKDLNKHLQQDQVKWRELTQKLEGDLEKFKKEKDAEVADLNEQLRDIMFYIQAQKQIEESPLREEIVDGQVIVDKSSELPSTSKGGRKKKR